jgi:hypothetical protein
MTTGALIFAHNNEQTDYVAMAAWCAENIRRHLDIPVALVTDRPTKLKFEQVIIQPSEGENGRWFSDYGTNVKWHNQTRVNAYELSPWDQTLVLDADYVVASDQLKTILASPKNFLAHRWAYDITGIDSFEGLNYFGAHNMPMWWATVMMFRRSEHARLIFETMSMIRDNWTHYRNIYKNSRGTYRNDHALSIALGVVNGHTLDHAGIPWDLASLTPDHQLTQLAADHYRVDFVNSDQKTRCLEVHNQDFHAMGKKTLGDIVANPC